MTDDARGATSVAGSQKVPSRPDPRTQSPPNSLPLTQDTPVTPLMPFLERGRTHDIADGLRGFVFALDPVWSVFVSLCFLLSLTESIK